MAVRKSRQNQHASTMASIRNKYTGDQKQNQTEMRAPNKHRKRRLILFGIVTVAFLIWAGSFAWGQYEVLQEEQAELQQAEGELEEAQQLNAELREQIERLHDPEYIAEIARRDYFLTKDGEIIFNITD